MYWISPDRDHAHVVFFRPQNREELFNLRHASARNAIERIFGVLKKRFRILLIAPEYNLNIQARLPAALCTIHNFIRIHTPDEPADQYDADSIMFGGGGGGGNLDDDQPAGETAGDGEPSERRDAIAQAMWDDYQQVLQERGQMDVDSDETSD